MVNSNNPNSPDSNLSHSNLNSSNTNKYFFKSALIEDAGQTAWRNDVAISIADGLISDIQFDFQPKNTEVELVPGVAIPAIANIHSHAFQRGFAGLSEYRTGTKDSFWTWRKLMYDFVGRLSPEDVYVIARQLYLEMLTTGYSWVGEFHYLHNSDSGATYGNLSEMSDAVLRAANDVGIGICLIPVLYQRSGFNEDSTNEGQKRFALTCDQYFELLESCKSKIEKHSNATLGMAAHSLRAVSLESLQSALKFRDEVLPNCPFHIHVAEQTKEIDDCISATGKRSVEYLLDNANVDQHWCLIHSTHMNEKEIQSLAKTGATVGLCPTTEANLGDGIFPAKEFLEAGGTISLGSDSHCSVDLREEMRILEYGQRLRDLERAVLGSGSASVGRRIFESCADGGGKAIGVLTGKIAVGYRADVLVVDDQCPVIAGASEDRLLDRLIFSNQGNPIARRMIGGHWVEGANFESLKGKSCAAFLDLNNRLFQ